MLRKISLVRSLVGSWKTISCAHVHCFLPVTVKVRNAVRMPQNRAHGQSLFFKNQMSMASLQSYGAEVLSTNTFNMQRTSTLINFQAADVTPLDVANWSTSLWQRHKVCALRSAPSTTNNNGCTSVTSKQAGPYYPQTYHHYHRD